MANGLPTHDVRRVSETFGNKNYWIWGVVSLKFTIWLHTALAPARPRFCPDSAVILMTTELAYAKLHPTASHTAAEIGKF
jgi:hypothetical protein